MSAGLVVFAAYHLAIGFFMVVAPGTFFPEIGPFGARNDHYIRDTATYRPHACRATQSCRGRRGLRRSARAGGVGVRGPAIGCSESMVGALPRR